MKNWKNWAVVLMAVLAVIPDVLHAQWLWIPCWAGVVSLAYFAVWKKRVAILLAFMLPLGVQAIENPGLTPQQYAIYSNAVSTAMADMVATNAPLGDYRLVIDLGGGQTQVAWVKHVVSGVIVIYCTIRLGIYIWNEANRLASNWNARTEIELSNMTASASSTFTAIQTDESLLPTASFAFDFIMGNTNSLHSAHFVTGGTDTASLLAVGTTESTTVQVLICGRTITVNDTDRENTITTVMRSPDLQAWETVCVINAPLGQPVHLEDAEVAGVSMFYRLQ